MRIVRTPTITKDSGISRENAALATTPAMKSVRSISSVAYATDESASDEKIASAVDFPSRSWISCAVGNAGPSKTRFTP